MTYLLYVKVSYWSDWMYYGMVHSLDRVTSMLSSLEASFYAAKYETEKNGS